MKRVRRSRSGRQLSRCLALWAGGLMAVGLLMLAVPLACTTTIRPPVQPADPVSVYVLDHGFTATLAVTAADGGLVRYAYGDWNYYALANTSVVDGLLALFWPTQGTLGRAPLPAAADGEAVREQTDAGGVHEVRVERLAAERLVARLNDAYEARRDTEVENAPYGMWFVRQDPDYTYFHNSNHAVAGWLEELGCEVRGPAFVSRWRVTDPA
jgi:hypothetical protein